MSAKVLLAEPCLDHGYVGTRQGYAEVRRPRGAAKKVRLHRWVFLQEHGFLPPVVMHKCDNPRCIEITHLQAGTTALNNQDRARKGRSNKLRPDRRSLTLEQAEEIRLRFGSRAPRDPVNGPCALAREFGIGVASIYDIATGRTYVA